MTRCMWPPKGKVLWDRIVIGLGKECMRICICPFHVVIKIILNKVCFKIDGLQFRRFMQESIGVVLGGGVVVIFIFFSVHLSVYSYYVSPIWVFRSLERFSRVRLVD